MVTFHCHKKSWSIIIIRKISVKGLTGWRWILACDNHSQNSVKGLKKGRRRILAWRSPVRKSQIKQYWQIGAISKLLFVCLSFLNEQAWKSTGHFLHLANPEPYAWQCNNTINWEIHSFVQTIRNHSRVTNQECHDPGEIILLLVVVVPNSSAKVLNSRRRRSKVLCKKLQKTKMWCSPPDTRK
jgi:hypothetical protein